MNGASAGAGPVDGAMFWSYLPEVSRPPHSDDWFAGTDSEELQVPDDPSAEGAVPSGDDWLRETDVGPARPTWAQTIDRRVVVVSASLLALLIAVLAAAGVFSGGAANAPPSRAVRTATTQATTSPTTVAPPRQLPAPAKALRLGDTGAEVAVLQRALASLGFSSGKVDSQYGPATARAVARFQRSVKLAPDGILGPATLRALANALRGP